MRQPCFISIENKLLLLLLACKNYIKKQRTVSKRYSSYIFTAVTGDRPLLLSCGGRGDPSPTEMGGIFLAAGGETPPLRKWEMGGIFLAAGGETPPAYGNGKWVNFFL